MKRKIIQTADGSSSLIVEDWGETYHSRHGAIQEAKHVFIQNGLSLFKEQSVAVLEIGFGTGLNAFITFLEAEKRQLKIDYVGVEAYPILKEEAEKLNYVTQLEANQYVAQFELMHTSEWGVSTTISDHFSLTKRQQYFNEISDENRFDLIYFDAFGFQYQPELWSVEIFRKMFVALKPNGILVTYACRGPIKRAMQEAGFTTRKLAGPPGKREMLRAEKIIT
ncbi:tRNA (5-methylaminomethyl-2-thiouridine)(34)-methyltransferase MnmD [Flavobacterium suncheonense]|uniref:SAM-dependent methyltransferase n=1 Tax=Flavobacterium suncheonense GH29-5 = DSM 17707 TaxID=1121899 RepID=A0A0A2MEW2_9FLAO|nr:tRNA (5-methylaminomethyl-2-thiouridine)(34)-methyltransferase MnmD [Flavobacterium suncheonense]KGO90824.1 SAM-dependent methyltransferase [Flavobacterium suncheonense GH29-5 = DSM 17707]